MLCFALSIAAFAAGIATVLTLRYSYARHDRAFREIRAIVHPTDAGTPEAFLRYFMRRGSFTTEDLLTGIGVSLFITLAFATNGWTHHRRLSHGQDDTITNLVARIFAWFIVGILLLALISY